MKYDIIAFDDGYFKPSFKSLNGRTLLIGVLYSDGRIQRIAHNRILIDGLNATRMIIDMAKNLSSYSINPVIMLDGITYAGFDVADPDKIYVETGIPVITFIQYPLDLERIKRALMKHFKDYRERYDVIKRVYTLSTPLMTPWRVTRFYSAGLPLKEASILLKNLMIYSPVPEPLRIAHMLASTISKYAILKGYLP